MSMMLHCIIVTSIPECCVGYEEASKTDRHLLYSICEL